MKINKLTPDKIILEELGQRLAKIRKQQGFTQEKLALEAGLGVATLRRIEDGQDSQMGSWIKLFKALAMLNAIDALLPENIHSPMAEVKAKHKNRNVNKIKEPSFSWGDQK